MRPFCSISLLQSPVISDPGGKGKGRTAGIIGLGQYRSQQPRFDLPSIDISCDNSARFWPGRISPGSQTTPQLRQGNSPVAVLLSADSGKQLGNLLFKLVEWIMAPPTIDLELEEFGGDFQPPAGTILSPNSSRIPDESPLISENSTYSMLVHLSYLSRCDCDLDF